MTRDLIEIKANQNLGIKGPLYTGLLLSVLPFEWSGAGKNSYTNLLLFMHLIFCHSVGHQDSNIYMGQNHSIYLFST